MANAPVIETRVCQYETTPDNHWVIDRHPNLEHLWLVGGGSGHGFKHGPRIGRYVVDRVTEAPGAADPELIERFSVTRSRAVGEGMRSGVARPSWWAPSEGAG
jgi:glycine/D-amino acid oxidase-like deaminating enzyme